MSSPTWTVRVPGSTSNLGPGFDFLGLALSLYIEVEVERAPTGATHALVEASGEAHAWPDDTRNLVFRAFDAGRARLGAAPLALRMRARSEVPVGRGLGSSGAAIAAGLRLAQTITNGTETHDSSVLQAWVEIGAELDGHPDNTTASLVGGCTLAIPTDAGLEVVRQPLHADIGIAVAWPTETLATSAARAALPTSVPFADAVDNPRRLALLLEGLRNADARLMKLGVADRLHVRHRLPLIPGAARALAAAEAQGAWLATISGSGTTLVAMGPHDRAAQLAEAMRVCLGADPETSVGHVVEPASGLSG